MPQTEIIILRKTPYKENSVIITGITPEFGSLDFIVNSAKKTRFPIIDLFREINITFKHNDGRFQKIYKTELINNYDSIALDYNLFQEYCELSKFILKHSLPMHESKLLYFALKTGLDTYTETLNSEYSFTPILAKSLIHFAFLYDFGFLPIDANNEEWFAELANIIVTQDIQKILKIDSSYWIEFNNWLSEALAKYLTFHC